MKSKLLLIASLIATISFSYSQVTFTVDFLNADGIINEIDTNGDLYLNGVVASTTISATNIALGGQAFLNIRQVPDANSDSNGTLLNSVSLNADNDDDALFVDNGDGTANRTWVISNIPDNGNVSTDLAEGDSNISIQLRHFGPTISIPERTVAGYASSTLVAIADPALSIPSVSKSRPISLYPNPATSTITVGNNAKSKTYKILNVLGQTVNEEKATGKIDVSYLANGIYFLVTDSGSAKFVKK